MIGLFSVFKVIEPQGNFMEELYDPGEYKLTWMHVVTFLTLHIYIYIYIYIKYTYFATLIKYILKLL
jgi:hypothetical protein